MYDTLDELIPEDRNGNKKAFVDINGGNVRAIVPEGESTSLSALYGLTPTTIAQMDKPFQLIPRQSEVDNFTDNQEYSRTMLRSALRRIIDEV